MREPRERVPVEPVALPFGLGPDEARAGVVLVHGFTGTPFEMRPLGEALAARGFQVAAPRLAGHCGTTEDLRRTRWPDWLASVEEVFEGLKARCDEVAVVGLSLGGLLTLELARRRPAEVKAIAVLASALWLTPAAMRFERAIYKLPFAPRLALPKIAGSDIADPEMREKNQLAQGRAGMPLAALHSLIELGRHLEPRLGEVTAPALVGHARLDHTVPYSASERIAASLGSREIKMLTLERSFHCITIDVERETLFRAVAEHLLEHLHP